MSEAPRRESPLAGYLAGAPAPAPPDAAGVLLRERPFLGHLDLRGDPSDDGFLRSAGDVLGVELPLDPNTVAAGGETSALWLGPDEWLLITPPDREVDLAGALGDALAGRPFSVVDVTGGQTVVNLSGARARDLLAKGCTLDLHPRAFGPGRCAQTLVGRAAVTIRQLDDSPSYDLIVRRSYADYLASWIEDAAREYGLAVEGA